MMLSVASANLNKVILTYHTKDVLNQVSFNLDHEIKRYSSSNSSIKIGINKKGKKLFQNGAIRGLQIRAGFKDFKSVQKDKK